jgi:glucose dehydrogenase
MSVLVEDLHNRVTEKTLDQPEKSAVVSLRRQSEVDSPSSIQSTAVSRMPVPIMKRKLYVQRPRWLVPPWARTQLGALRLIYVLRGNFTQNWAILLYATLLMLSASDVRADDNLARLQTDPGQWVTQNKNYASIRYSDLDQINSKNAGRLKVSWSASTGVLRGHAGGPLVVDGVLYVVAPFPNTVWAFDLAHPGVRLWEYEPRQDPNVIPRMCCDTVNRGLAYADGLLFLYQADTHLVALDAKSGEKVWEVVNGDIQKGESATGAPFVFKDSVVVGISGGAFGVRGHVTAYA